MPLPRFEDRYPAYTSYGYGCTNEEPDQLLQLVDGQKFNKVLSIASGGEVPFFVLLPVSNQVIAIDHTYRSIAACFVKAAMMQHYGPMQTRGIFLSAASHEAIMAKMAYVWHHLPKALGEKLVNYPLSNVIDSSDWSAIKRDWATIPEEKFLQAYNRMHLITIIHGDILLDIRDQGFDAAYVSNCWEHSDRAGGKPPLSKMAELLKPDGLMLYTKENDPGFGVRGYEQHRMDGEVVKQLKGKRTRWYHCSVRRTPPVPPTITTTQHDLVMVGGASI